jgi:chaperonin GroES
MSLKIQPLADYVVAQSEEAQSVTKSGIYLPEGATEKPKTAKIIAIGKNVHDLKVGDKIVYKSYSTNEIKIDQEEYILVKEEDVLAIVKN